MPVYIVNCTENLPEDLPVVFSKALLNILMYAINFVSPQSNKLFLNYIKSFKCLVCLQCVTITVVSRKITINRSLYSLSYGYISILF